ncbi:MAG: hypothetical protein KC431_18355, partial [Myxococcales bacterium]|nr:hypothetical protein [Myxococcales bacterium]
MDDSGLLREYKPGHYEFTHLSMVEYLAARAIQRDHEGDVASLVEFVRARYETPIWWNTLLFILDDRRESSLADGVFAALLEDEPHESNWLFLLIILREEHQVGVDHCHRLFEVCLERERARLFPFSRYFAGILASEVNGEILERWFAEHLARERGARLAGLLMSLPRDFPVDAHVAGRSLESLESLLDHEIGLGILSSPQFLRVLDALPSGSKLRWAMGRPINEAVAEAMRSRREMLRESWPQRWIPALLARAAWLSGLPLVSASVSRWSVGGISYQTSTRLAFGC